MFFRRRAIMGFLKTLGQQAAPRVDGVDCVPTPGQVWKYWVQCEEIAMHFNKLIMDFRLRALGGVALSSGFMVAMLRDESFDRHIPFLAAWLIAMCVVWIAIGIIDRFYYQRLLHGVVIEILRIEADYGGNFLRCSRQIEHTVNDGLGNEKHWPRWAFYLLPLIPLFGGAIWCFCIARHEPATRSAAEHSVHLAAPATTHADKNVHPDDFQTLK